MWCNQVIHRDVLVVIFWLRGKIGPSREIRLPSSLILIDLHLLSLEMSLSACQRFKL